MNTYSVLGSDNANMGNTAFGLSRIPVVFIVNLIACHLLASDWRIKPLRNMYKNFMKKYEIIIKIEFQFYPLFFQHVLFKIGNWKKLKKLLMLKLPR